MQYFGFDRPSFQSKYFGFGSSVFDPVTLFAGGKQGVLYDPSKLSSLWQNAARTIPVTQDGDPVGCMDDLSGNGSHASQSVSAARPIYKTDGVLHWLQFDGVDDCLTISSGFCNPIKQQLVVIAYSLLSYYVYGCVLGATNIFIKIDTGANGKTRRGVTYTMGITSVASATTTTDINEPIIRTVSYNNATGVLSDSKNRKDAATATGSGDVLSGNSIAIGRDESIASRNVEMKFYGLVLLSHDGVDKADAEQYLATKAGVTL